MSFKLLTPKEIKISMGRRRDEVKIRIKIGRVMRISPTIMLVKVEKSLRRKLSFHASYAVETI